MDRPLVFACPCGGYEAHSVTESRHAERIATHRATCPTDRRQVTS